MMTRVYRSAVFSSLIVSVLVSGMVITTPIAFAHIVARHVQQTVSASCLQPPQNVDLMTLSDTELQSYGLPNHTTINENPQLWTRILAHAKHHSCDPGHPTNRSHTKNRITNGSIGCTAAGEMCPNTNWAGNEAVGSRGTYRETDFEFYVPSISTAVVGSHVSIWTGIGGDPNFGGSTILVQAGVDISVDSNHHQSNVSWWEVYPGYTEQNLPLPAGLHVGDHMAVVVHSNSNGEPNQNVFFIDNFTTNDYVPKSLGGALSDSASAEWIVERPIVGSGLAPLAQFQNSGQPANTVRLYSCEAQKKGSSTDYSESSLSHLYNQIYVDPNKLNTLMANVGPISSSGYDNSVTWIRGS